MFQKANQNWAFQKISAKNDNHDINNPIEAKT